MSETKFRHPTSDFIEGCKLVFWAGAILLGCFTAGVIVGALVAAGLCAA